MALTFDDHWSDLLFIGLPCVFCSPPVCPTSRQILGLIIFDQALPSLSSVKVLMQSRGPGPQFGLREVIGQREKPRWPPVRLKVTSVSRQKRRRARQQDIARSACRGWPDGAKIAASHCSSSERVRCADCCIFRFAARDRATPFEWPFNASWRGVP